MKLKPKVAEVQSRSKKLWTNKKSLLALLLVVLLLAAAGAYYKLKYKSNNVTSKCTGNFSYYKQVATNIQTKDTEKLKLDVEQIQQDPNYKTDENCLYPIAVYYLETSDIEKAEQTIADIEAVQKTNNFRQFSVAYTTNNSAEYPINVDELKLWVKAKRIKANSKPNGSINESLMVSEEMIEQAKKKAEESKNNAQ